MDLILPDDSEIPFVLPTSGVDARGNKTVLATPATARVSDTALIKIVQPDPATPTVAESGVLGAVGPLGDAQFIVEDANLSILVNVRVVASDTVNLSEVVFGPVRKAT